MFNFSSNVGSNWGLPSGYSEMLAKAKSFSPIVGIGEAAAKYGEQSNKLSALQKGLSTTVSEYGKLAGLSKEEINQYLQPHDNESRVDHIARLEAVARYLPERMKQNAYTSQADAMNKYLQHRNKFWSPPIESSGVDQLGVSGLVPAPNAVEMMPQGNGYVDASLLPE